MSRLFAPLLLLALAACSAPTVPDFTYYRLPRPQPLQASPAVMFEVPVVVDAFNADGLYGDQALIYALDPGAQQLRQYHYQLWTDPPTRSLQRRLIEQLRDANVSAQVTDELPASHPAMRVGGVILRLDRVPEAEAGAFRVVVGLRLRVDGPDGTPVLDEYYRAEKAAAGGELKATVDAYGAAVDAVYAHFYADLRSHARGAHAR